MSEAVETTVSDALTEASAYGLQDVSIGVAHWAEQVNGGGERVAWELARAFDAPLWTSVRDPAIEPDDVEVRELFDGWTRKLAARGGVSQMAANQFGWEIAQPLRDYDILITSGNEPLAYVAPPEQTWVHYVHHTSRKATDLLYTIGERKTGFASKFTIPIERVVRKIERQIYSRYAQKPDLLVANSDVIARRINRDWGREAAVAYPPVPVDEYSRYDGETGDHFLVLSRLDWHKQIGEIIDVFNDRDEMLIIAGDGSERERLEDMADDNIRFAGYVSEKRKREMLSGAKAVINNALAEDFGLTTVEPMAAGTPVIGVNEGFTQHLVIERETGIGYDRGELDAAIDLFNECASEFDEAAIESFADRFNCGRFAQEMYELSMQAHRDAQVSAPWE